MGKGDASLHESNEHNPLPRLAQWNPLATSELPFLADRGEIIP
jgi:hypothetical protein